MLYFYCRDWLIVKALKLLDTFTNVKCYGWLFAGLGVMLLWEKETNYE
jgi:hypothetical protein